MLYVVIGFLVTCIGIPFIESFQTILSALTEFAVSRINTGIAKSNRIIQDIAEEPTDSKQVVGFAIPDDDDYDYEEDDD